ncbi:MAG: LamG domain-containing protein [Candidatus Micrarchaeia archaeon]
MGSVKARGQSSTEFLLLFAAAVVVFAIIYAVTVGRSDALSSRNVEISANLAVTDLANAAREVHSQGAGARKIVTIDLPRSYDPDNSRITQNAIILRAKDTDYVRTFSFSLQGSLPDSSGTYYWPVENDGTSVIIGDKVARINRTSISAVVAPGSGYSDAILVSSTSIVQMAGTVSSTWSNGSVNLTFGPSDFTLLAYGTQQLDLLVNTSALAKGTYSGQLFISLVGAGSTGNQSFQVPITLVVSNVISSPPVSLIQFLPPTPANSSMAFGGITINASIQNVSQPSGVIFNWNSTNYTVYNDSLVLAYNFDDVSAIGDTASKVTDISRYGNNGTIYGNTLLLLHMDENTGNTTYDESVWRNNGTCYNMNGGTGVTNCGWATGKSGTGVQFDGVDDYVVAGNASAANVSNAVTVMAWIYPRSLSSPQIVGKYRYGPGTEEHQQFMLFFASPGIVSFQFINNTAGDPSGTNNGFATNAVPANSWTFVAAAYDRDRQSIRVYLNGVLNGSRAAYGPLCFANNSVNIGAFNRIGDSFMAGFNGSIDEVGVFSRALSDAEVAAAYAAGRARHADWDPEGKWESAMRFDGVDDYLQANGSALGGVFGDAVPWTVGAWVKIQGNSYNHILIAPDPSFGNNYGFDFLVTDVGFGDVFVGVPHWGYGWVRYSRTAVGVVPRNAWTYVVATHDGSTNNFSIYVNGVQMPLALGLTQPMYGQNVTNAANYPWWIGSGRGYSSNGSIDEVRVWNRSLSAAEIQQQYYSNLAKYAPDKWLFSYSSPLLEGSVWYSLFAQNDSWSGRSALRKVVFSSGIAFFQAPTGTSVATFTQAGDVILSGACSAGASCATPPSGALAFRDSLGVSHAYITEAGNLCLEDASCGDHDASCTASDNLFVVKDANNVTVSYISETGQMCLVGSLMQNNGS